MALDSSIPLQIQPVQLPDQVAQYGKLLQLKALQGQGRLQDIQLQNEQQQQTDTQNLRKLFSGAKPGADGSYDLTALAPQVMATAPTQGSAILKSIGEMNKQQIEMAKAKTEAALQHLALGGQLLSGVKDQATYDAARAQAQAAGIDTSNMPAQYDPGTVQMKLQQSMAVKDQLTQQHQALTLAETQRHNLTDEKIGQQNANSRAALLGGFDAGPTGDSTVDFAAKAYLSTGKMPQLGAGSAVLRKQILARAAQITEGAGGSGSDMAGNIAQAGELAKAKKDFGTGAQGNAVRQFGSSIDHLDTLSQAVDALNNGNVPLLNKVGNAYAQQTGEAAPNNFETAKVAVSSEIAKVIAGANVGQGDREHWLGILDKANSPAQLKGAIDTIQHLMGAQLNNLERQYQRSTQSKTGFDNTFISDRALAIKNKITADEQAAQASMTNQAQPSGPAKQALSADDQAAINWANANPADPRAVKIKQLHGLQ